MIEDYLTTKIVAERLGVSHGRIRQLIADKRLPSVKIGQMNLVREADLVAISERKITGRPRKEVKQ